MSNIRRLKEPYKAERCKCCGQTLTYLLPIDRGTVDILRAISVAIYRKGINVIHPRKEMEISPGMAYDLMIKEGMLTSNQVGNLSRPRFHGLIARVKGNPGNYCLTPKGAKFLKGEYIPKFAIISKAENRQIGYYDPEEYSVIISDYVSTDKYWEGINFDIIEGKIVKNFSVEEESKQKSLLNKRIETDPADDTFIADPISRSIPKL